MNITPKDLLDAGVHFGHQVRRFNPKSKKYIYDHLHGVTIIDLEKTYHCLEKAADKARELARAGKQILFVGTKKQAADLVREAAGLVQMPYVASRWMGGALTNYATIHTSLKKYKEFLKLEETGELDKFHKKEGAAIRRRMKRMHRNFEGLLEMEGQPGALFIIDTAAEYIAVAEANRLQIPIIGVVDTNADPTVVDYPIPGNDDSIKSIRIILDTIVEAIQTGQAEREQATGTPAASYMPMPGIGGGRSPEEAVPTSFSAAPDEEVSGSQSVEPAPEAPQKEEGATGDKLGLEASLSGADVPPAAPAEPFEDEPKKD